MADFGEGRGTLLGSDIDIKDCGLDYSPKYIFDDYRLDGLLNSADKIIVDYYGIVE